MGLSMQEKNALTEEASRRYRKASKKEKSIILDELTLYLNCNRKYLIHKLANWGKITTVNIQGKTVRLKASQKKRRKGGGRKPVYDEDFTKTLRAIWIFFWYRSGKILAPFMREQINFLVKPFCISKEVKKLLLAVSPATIDRKLKADKRELAFKGKSGSKPGNMLKKQIPIRTYYADADKKPGFFEIDTVHHCGHSDSGEFCLTLSATDVYSGWIELRPLLNKAHKWVLQEISAVKSSLPFPVLGLDSDNGSEFINSAMLKWCAEENIQFTRTRAYHKNDNCFVEQKNNSCVRNFVGYGRFTSIAERDALASVYISLCPLLNYFMPSFKLIAKIKVGSKSKKIYDKKVLSPYQRLLACADVTDAVKVQMSRQFKSFNPVVLQREVHRAVDTLIALNRSKELEGVESLVVSALQAF